MSDVHEAPEWIGSLPGHWRRTPVGTLFDERKDFVSDSEFPALSVTKGGVVPQLSDVAKSQNGDARKLVCTGDFVINSRSDRKGSSGISELDGSVSVVYTVLCAREGLDLNFAHHLLRSSAFQEEFYRWGSGIVADLWSTRYSAMKRIALPMPPLDEQLVIADYLDRETQKIDELITEQRGLIETLRERRIARVTDAVFSSKARNVPLRRIAEVVDCAHITAELVENDTRFPVASIAECQGRYVDLSAAKYTSSKFFDHLRAGDRSPRPGDLLFIRNASVGLVAAVAQGTPDFAVGQETVLLRRRSNILPDFLRYVLTSARVKHDVQRAMIGSTFKRINVSAIRSLPIPLVPVHEQQHIVTYLDDQTSRIDELIAESEDLIALSQERRAALITAAVTGQIDVKTAA